MRIIRSAIVVAAAFVAACGDKVTVPAAVTTTVAPKVNSVTVAPSIATMNVGDNIQLTAAVNADAGLATTVTWQSQDPTKVSTDANGKITAVAVTPGVAVCATSTVDTGKKGCATVAVSSAATPVANGVTVTPSAATIAVGGTITLTSVVSGSTGISQGVTWTSADPTKATVGATTGIVTGVLPTSGVSICAASTVSGSTAKGCAAIVVTAAPVATANSVTVTPSAATLQMVAPGGTQPTVTLTATVALQNSTNTGVTWTSADPTKATVAADANGNGKVTPVAGGSTSICAASVVTPSVQGCSTITVGAFVAPAPASVSILSITGAGGLNAPVNNAAVAGAVNVSLNVSAGGQTVTKVALTINGVEVDNQTFTSAQAAALRAASDAAVATQSVPATIVFFVNTARNITGGGTCPTGVTANSGNTCWANGAYTIGANLYTVAGGATPSNTAKNATNVTFANTDGFSVAVTGTNSAVDATGYRWIGGGAVTFAATPVIYSGLAIGSVTASLAANTATGTTCAAFPAGNGNATTATAGVYSIAVAYAGGVSPAGCTTTFPNMPVITAVDGNGNNMTLATNGIVNTQAGVRLDNVAPSVPAFIGFGTANFTRTGNWINDAVVFNATNDGATAAQANNWIGTASTDAGIGLGAAGAGITYTVTQGANGANLNAARFGTGTPLTSSASLAPSAGNAAYCAVVTATDALGNRTTQPAAGAACGGTTQSVAFGVDRYAPIVTFAAGQTNNTATNAFASPTYTMSVTDTGVVGNSQFGAVATNVSASTVRRVAAGTTTTIATAGGGAYPGVTIDLSGQATAGYYTTNVTAKDQAGNSTTTAAPRVGELDTTVPVILAVTQSAVSFQNASSPTFNTAATDNMDLWRGWWTLPYGASPTLQFEMGNTTFNTFNTSPAVTASANPWQLTIPFYAPSMQTMGPGGAGVTAVPAAAGDSATVNAGTALTGIVANVQDMNNGAQSFAGATGTVSTAAYAPVNVTASGAGALAAWPAIGAGVFTSVTKIYVASSADAAPGNVSRTGATAGSPLSTNLTLTMTGAFGATAPTIARLEFWGQCGAVTATNWVMIGSAQTSPAINSQVDNGAVRTWTWPSVTWTPGTSCGAAGAKNITAVLYNATGQGLATVIKQVTLVN